MDKMNIKGLIETPLKQIFHPLGDVWHAMKGTDCGYDGFGEAYFSTIHYKDIKVWKKHLEMTLNFVVPVGCIKIVIFDDRSDSPSKGQYQEFILSQENYKRITIPPNLWVAFQGLDKGLNLLLNIANITHDPTEIVRKTTLAEIPYSW